MKTLILIGLSVMQIYAVPLLKQSPSPDIDKNNMFNMIYTFPEQLDQALRIAKRISLKHNYDQIELILFVGMGGSGMAAEVAQSLIKKICKKPIFLHKNYQLPAWVNKQTLVVCISYSGETEETLSCFAQAHAAEIPIIGLCSGGSLLEQMLSFDYDHIIVPTGLQPRAALGYLSIPLVCLMHKLGYIDDTIITELEKTPAHLKNYRDILSLQEQKNPAFLYAANLKQYMPVLFGESDTTECIARRWVCQFAENSKMVARTHSLPELNHNEIVGWKNNQFMLKGSVIIWLIDQSMHERNRKQAELTRQLLDGLPITQLQFEGVGSCWCHRLFYLIHFGDWISYWCAITQMTDPTTVEVIDVLKRKMRSA